MSVNTLPSTSGEGALPSNQPRSSFLRERPSRVYRTTPSLCTKFLKEPAFTHPTGICIIALFLPERKKTQTLRWVSEHRFTTGGLNRNTRHMSRPCGTLLIMRNQVQSTGLTRELLVDLIADKEYGLLAVLVLISLSNESFKQARLYGL